MDERVMRRLGAAGGVVGPAAFVATWALLGARAIGYSPVEDPISRLAAMNAPTRVAMTAGLLAYAGGVGLFAASAGTGHRSRAAAVALAVNAAGTVAVAALPLAAGLDPAHGVAAGISYAGLAAAPLLHARSASGRDARWSVVAGVVSGAALLASAVVPPTGLLQRIGLTTGDAWIVAHALIRRHR